MRISEIIQTAGSLITMTCMHVKQKLDHLDYLYLVDKCFCIKSFVFASITMEIRTNLFIVGVLGQLHTWYSSFV